MSVRSMRTERGSGECGWRRHGLSRTEQPNSLLRSDAARTRACAPTGGGGRAWLPQRRSDGAAGGEFGASGMGGRPYRLRSLPPCAERGPRRPDRLQAGLRKPGPGGRRRLCRPRGASAGSTRAASGCTPASARAGLPVVEQHHRAHPPSPRNCHGTSPAAASRSACRRRLTVSACTEYAESPPCSSRCCAYVFTARLSLAVVGRAASSGGPSLPSHS